jgi:phosphoribosylaminoimidazole-succinocarboxamide synthase
VVNSALDSRWDLPGWKHLYSGKVRDIYVEDTIDDVALAKRALIVASDRVSAFDHVLEPGIPRKGELLTTLSLWWFDQLVGIPNHLVPDHTLNPNGSSSEIIPTQVSGRSMLVKILDMYPIECVVRGYLTGTGWKEYQQHGSVCGTALPPGLKNGDKLPEPLYTPAWKAPPGEHDHNISYERTIELVGAPVANTLREMSLEIFRKASTITQTRGVILADSKFEFGADRETGHVTLADEVLTSDSSRYWDAVTYATAPSRKERMTGFDKQLIRDWLTTNWNQHGNPPTLPPTIVTQTTLQYQQLLRKLTGS